MREPAEGQLVVLRRSPEGEIGVAKTIRRKGSGHMAQNGMHLKVRYSCMLSDGTVVDSTAGNDREIILGMRRLHGIGADICLSSMRAGERCLLTVSPSYSYGDHGAPPAIPPGSQISFDLELVEAWYPSAFQSTKFSLLGALALLIFILGYFCFKFHKYPSFQAFVQGQ